MDKGEYSGFVHSVWTWAHHLNENVLDSMCFCVKLKPTSGSLYWLYSQRLRAHIFVCVEWESPRKRHKDSLALKWTARTGGMKLKQTSSNQERKSQSDVRAQGADEGGGRGETKDNKMQRRQWQWSGNIKSLALNTRQNKLAVDVWECTLYASWEAFVCDYLMVNKKKNPDTKNMLQL